MNIFSIIGFLIAIAVLIVGLFLSTTNVKMFVDYPSMFIVLGGTFAATAISFQVDRLGALLKVFFLRVIKGKKADFQNVIKELMVITEKYRKGDSLANIKGSTSDHFIIECLELLEDNILDHEELFEVMDSRVQNMNNLYTEEANKFKSLGKFPPAFGMMGTTIGMIVLLANLGGADAIKMIGPAMGVCLITTLYGVVIANLAVIPIAENLIESSKENYLKNMIIVEGIKLVQAKTNPVIVAEKLNSFLHPSQRLNWKEVVN